ncbi:MAG: TenA family transcriptional regulator [Candidatus Brocadia sp.]
MAKSVDQFFDELESEILKHPAVKSHPYLQKFSKKADKRAAKLFGEQYYCFSRHFSRYLAGAVAICPDEAGRAPLIKNLFEEYGGRSEEQKGMNPELTHPALFRRFLKAVGVDTSQKGLDSIKPLPETALFVEKYLNIHYMNYVEALGALGPGTEFIVPTMYVPIRDGLKHAGLSDDDVLFFSAHIELDVEHAANIRKSLAFCAQTDEDQARIRKGAFDFLDTRAVLWSGLERASEQYFK